MRCVQHECVHIIAAQICERCRHHRAALPAQLLLLLHTEAELDLALVATMVKGSARS